MSPFGQLLFALVAMLLGLVPLAESVAALRRLRRISRAVSTQREQLMRRALHDLRLTRGEAVPPSQGVHERATAAIRLSVWRRAALGISLLSLGLLLALDSLR